jgi:DNA-directed RNA polymerase specialized sigma24 family protein
MIPYNEKIKLRALKEEFVLSPDSLKVPADIYQLALETSIKKLSDLEQQVIILRFLEFLPIAKVATYLGLSWDEADRFIDKTVLKLQREMSIFIDQRNKADTSQTQSA